MNPDQRTPQQQDIQQTVSDPVIPPNTPLMDNQVQQQVNQSPNQLPKQSNKQLPVIIGVILVIVGVIVGIFFLLSSNNEPQPKNQSSVIEDSTPTQQDKTDTTQVTEQTTTPSPATAQADSQRKSNSAKLAEAVNEYAANKNGKLPTIQDIDESFKTNYLGGQFNDPSTNSPYKIVEIDPKTGEIQYKKNSTCGSDNTIISGSSRQVAVRVLLNDNTYYCTNN
jgi:flagellar basal body-associated protein FliL